MNPNNQTKRTFHDIVHQGFDRPRVRLFVDLTDFDCQGLISLFDDAASLIKTMVRYARSFGSLLDQKVMLPMGEQERDQYRDLVRTVVQEFRDFDASGPVVPCIYMLVGTHPYLYADAAESLASKGNAVIVVGKETRENAQVVQHDLVYYLNAAKLADRGERPEVDTYNFGSFIELLLSHENKMPFVSAKYFVTKQMWRLGSQNPEVNQRIFQAARDRGIIELGKSENVDTDAPPVTTCKLNRDHPAVKVVMDSTDSSDFVRPYSGGLSHRLDLSSVVAQTTEPDPEP